jgi:protein-S-isoprenylcysteine O-methyltransferase Ste14
LLSVLANPINFIILLAWVVFLLFWGISAIITKPTKGNRNWAAVILMVVAAVSLYLLLRHASIPKNINSLLWQRKLPLSIVAVAFVLVGLFILIWARSVLGVNWNANVETKEWQALVQKGPYAKVRHPMYTGLVTMVLGSAIAYGRMLGVIIFVVFIAGFCLKALQEESILIKRYAALIKNTKPRQKHSYRTLSSPIDGDPIGERTTSR